MEAQSNGSEGICVGVRMRPLNQKEIKEGSGKFYECQNSTNTISPVSQFMHGQPSENVQTFTYDKVFDEFATTADVYSHMGQKIVAGVVSGINGTIFACE